MSDLILVLETLLAPFVGLGVVASFALSRRRKLLADLWEELPERCGGLAPEARAKLQGRRIWWLHAASAGEVGGLIPVIESLASRPDAPALVVTTMTAAGRDAARAIAQVAWAQIAPVDAWPFVSRFIKALHPERMVLAETEIWPSTLILAARAGLKPSLINARLGAKSLSRLKLLSPLLAPALDSLSLVAAQSPQHAERFNALGVAGHKIRVSGNCKYDRVHAAAASAEADERLARLGWQKAPLFVAGCTHPGEEDAVLAGFLQAKTRRPELKLIMAPRHVERSHEALRSLKDSSLRVELWSKIGPASRPRPDTEALLVDSMGSLGALYARAQTAFVGGTLVPVGGHNLLEPALAGVPVLFGPWTEHIEDPALLLERSGGGFRVRSAAEIADRLVELDETRARAAGAKAKEAAQRLQGATSRTLELLEGRGG